MGKELKTEHQVTVDVEFGSYLLKINNKIVKLFICNTVSLFKLSTKVKFTRPEKRIKGRFHDFSAISRSKFF